MQTHTITAHHDAMISVSAFLILELPVFALSVLILGRDSSHRAGAETTVAKKRATSLFQTAQVQETGGENKASGRGGHRPI